MMSDIIEQEWGDDSITKNSNDKNTIFGGLSIDFFALAHTLRTMAECVKHSLDFKNLHACYQAN